MTAENETIIREIYADVREIKAKLETDYRALYGDGHSGLVRDVAMLQQEMAVIKSSQSWFGKSVVGWITVIAWLANFALAVAAFLKGVK